MENKPVSPFDPHHPHYIDEPPLELDPAQQSMADALRVSFAVLKLAMVALTIIYLCSGIFGVSDQEVKVKLRFGKLVGSSPDEQVVMPGGIHIAFPQPIDTQVSVPIDAQRMQMTRAFWYALEGDEYGQTDEELAGKAGPLNPERDGSLLTGDANIVHARWQVTYSIGRRGEEIDSTQVINYVRNVGDIEQARALVRAAVEQGIVHAIAQTTADDVIKGQTSRVYIVARQHAQKTLDTIKSGIQIDQILAPERTMPLAVAEAYNRATQVQQQSGQRKDRAEQDAQRILAETAGEAHAALSDLIDEYEAAIELKDHQKISEIEDRFEKVFQSRHIETKDGLILAISGEVSKVINDAYVYKTQIVQRTKKEAERFEVLLQEYQKSPAITKNRLWQDARQQILSGDVDQTFYIPSGELYLDMNPDPKVKRERELNQMTQNRQQPNQ